MRLESLDEGPCVGGFEVVPSDTEDLPRVAKGFRIGGAGDLVIITPNDEELPFLACAVGETIPWSAKRVKATGTTATNIVAGY
jgi:hypothetical protein